MRFTLCVTMLLCVALSGCGARTGLRLPDATVEGIDASVDLDAFVRFEVCIAGRFRLVRRFARMVMVLDRSGSMSEILVPGGGTSRWDATRSALEQTVPMFQRDLDLGLFFYPRIPDNSPLGALQYCDLDPGTSIALAPARGQGATLLNMVRSSFPRGATPTAAAIRRVTAYLQARDSRGAAQYIVLLTDGIPNCSTTITPAECQCLGPSGFCDGDRGRLNCLDDEGTISSIARARSAGILTYVVGIDGSIAPQYQAILDRMADVGGRPQAGAPRYYSIRDFDQLREAFGGIQRTVASCAFVTPSRPDDPNAIDVELGGVRVARDPTGREGWNWTDRDFGELSFYGRACDLAIANPAMAAATVRCAR